MAGNQMDPLNDEIPQDEKNESGSGPTSPPGEDESDPSIIDGPSQAPTGSLPSDDGASGGGGSPPESPIGGGTPPGNEVKFIFRGAETANAESTKACKESLESLFGGPNDAAGSKIRHFRMGVTRRDRNAQAEITLKATDLVRVQSDDDELWFTAEDFLEWPEIRVIQKRESLHEIEWVPGSRDGSMPWNALTLISGWIGKKLGGYAKKQLAQRLEEKVRNGNELFRFMPSKEWHAVEEAPKGNWEKPWLLFIHGTFSSNEGSFGALWSSLNLTRLLEDYSGVLAFQHRTVSESPIDNLHDLAPLLPNNAHLVVVGFSRGGLVTELLGRAAPRMHEGRAEPGLDDGAIGRLDRALTAECGEETAKEQANKLRQIVRDLLEKQVSINLQIPIGAAIYGTTLTNTKLSKQLTLWIHLLRRASSWDVLSQHAIFAIRLLSSTAEELLDISDLPGLQAMHPHLALVQFLRKYPSPVPTAAVAAVADDSGLRRPLALLINSVFGVPNDWVVDRASMVPDAGPERWVSYQDVSEPRLYHTTYMKSARVQRLMRMTLEKAANPHVQLQQLIALGFEPVKPPTARGTIRTVSVTPANAPILFLLPGIMGTELYLENDLVWLDKLQLLVAGMDVLSLNPDRARTGRPLPEYDRLTEFLAQHYRVVRFGYDWRKSIFESARMLDQAVRDELQHTPGRSISFIAHSMGGMVVRAWMASQGSMWSTLSENTESRFLMLGTPTTGSHAMTKVLTGEERVLKLLAAGAASRRGLVEICAQYPGVLDLLPEFHSREHPRDSYFDPRTWDHFQAAHGYSVPSGSALSAALADRKRLRDSTWPTRTYYVAGRSERTPIAAEVKKNWFGRQSIEFTYTAEGDGRVPWAHGIPKGIDVWYVNTEHGDLASRQDLFEGYLDILRNGDTKADAFAKRPLSRAGSRSTGETLDAPSGATEAGSLVDDRALTRAALGSSPLRERTTAAQRIPRIRLIVSCADVASAAHPIMIGHYRSDGLYSAEKVMDQLLGGALQRSLDAGIHPQEIGEWRALNVKRKAGEERAIIVGLGEFGTLGISQLGRSLERAICGHIETHSQRCEPTPANLSSVLIGAGLGGVGVEPAIQTLIEALLRAAERCLQAGIVSQLPEEFEIVELYSDRAHLAFHVLSRLLGGSVRLRQAFELTPRLRHRNTGRRRAYADADLSWAQRVRITGAGNLDGFPEKLSFELYSPLAKVSIANVDLNTSLLSDLLRKSSTRGEKLVRESVALYNALLPAEIKSVRPSGERLLLILDHKSAALPWELLRPALPSTGAEQHGEMQTLPMSISGGLIRQLSLPRTPDYLSRVSEKTALIIADPDLGEHASAFWKADFGQLPAAADEGELVYKKLSSSGYRIAGPFRSQDQITTGLFSDRVKILHIAGHGVFEFRGDKRLTGLVLSNSCFGPADVRQIPSVPELVFINCCHLGKAPGGDYPKLAANLAQAFIEVGARAVIAAGWAVNDRGALRFAEVFYQNMLAGRMFIEAVREARTAVYEEYPWDSTWGAYQCYGSDSYTLQGATDQETSASRSRDEPPTESMRAYASYLDIRRTLIEPAIHRAMRADTALLASNEVDAVVNELRRVWAGTQRATELEAIHGSSELDLTKRLPKARQITPSTIPVSLHRALARLCDHAGCNLEAAVHAAWAWLADQYGVNTRSLTRVLVGAGKGALDITERYGVDKKDILEAWLDTASKYAKELETLPKTTKRLHTLSQFHARTALALQELGGDRKEVLEHLSQAISHFENTLSQRLKGVGDTDSTSSALVLWCTRFEQKTGDASHQRAIARSEITANALVMCKLARGWLGGEGLLAPESRAYSKMKWGKLKSPLFWRVHARWQRRLLTSMIDTSSKTKARSKTRQASKRVAPIRPYVEALGVALSRDPGHHHVGDVRYLLRFILAFAKQAESGDEDIAKVAQDAMSAWNNDVRSA